MEFTTVYLQAFSDPDGNGVADALYFPNQYLPVRDDIFGRIAWQLQTRAGVEVYAWMPVLAFDLRNKVKDAEYVIDSRTGKPSKESYLRLPPIIVRILKLLNLFTTIYLSMPNLTAFYSMMMHF